MPVLAEMNLLGGSEDLSGGAQRGARRECRRATPVVRGPVRPQYGAKSAPRHQPSGINRN